MVVKFYWNPPSPPSRAALLTAAALGLDMEFIIMRPLIGEAMTPEFLKMNPQHTIPTIDDDGFYVFESRTIMRYLVDKYGKDDDPLYPKDLQTRTTINRLLDFDNGTLYAGIVNYFFPQWFQKEPANPSSEARMMGAFQTLNRFLEDKTYLVGDQVTIADLSIVISVLTALNVQVDLSAYPNIIKWLELVTENAVDFKEHREKFRKELLGLIGVPAE